MSNGEVESSTLGISRRGIVRLAAVVLILILVIIATRQAYRCGHWTKEVDVAIQRFAGVSGPTGGIDPAVIERMEKVKPFGCPSY